MVHYSQLVLGLAMASAITGEFNPVPTKNLVRRAKKSKKEKKEKKTKDGKGKAEVMPFISETEISPRVFDVS